jgi:hypothetical protein
MTGSSAEGAGQTYTAEVNAGKKPGGDAVEIEASPIAFHGDNFFLTIETSYAKALYSVSTATNGYYL